MQQLSSVTYDGDAAVFEMDFLNAVHQILSSKVDITDLMMYMFASQVQRRNKTVANDIIKVMIEREKKLQKGETDSVNISQMVSEHCTVLKASASAEEGVNFLAVNAVQRDSKASTCSRCGKSGHEASSCWASKGSKAKDGTTIVDEPPAQPPAWLKKKWADGKKFREWQKTRSNTEEVSVVTTTAEVAALTPDDTIFDTGSGANLAGRGAQARGDAKIIDKANKVNIRSASNHTASTQGAAKWNISVADDKGNGKTLPMQHAQAYDKLAHSIMSVGKLLRGRHYRVILDIPDDAMIAGDERINCGYIEHKDTGDRIPVKLTPGDYMVLSAHIDDGTGALDDEKYVQALQAEVDKTSQEITQYVHHLCSHTQNKEEMIEFVKRSRGLKYNGKAIRPHHITDHFECAACKIAKITGVPLRKQGGHTFDAFAAETEEEPWDEHDIAQGDVFPLVEQHVLAKNCSFSPKIPGKQVSISSITSDVASGSTQRYRIDPASLECGELIMVDSKPYPFQVRGGSKMYCLVAVDVRSRRAIKVDHRVKDAVGIALKHIIVYWSLHLRAAQGKKVTIASDNCGSMRHVRETAISMGCNYVPLPVDEQSLNIAEGEIKLIFDGVYATLLHCKGVVPIRFARSVTNAVIIQNNYRPRKSRGFDQPIAIWNRTQGEMLDVSALVPIGNLMVQRKKAADKHVPIEKLKQILEISDTGELIMRRNTNPGMRGNVVIMIGYVNDQLLKQKELLQITNDGCVSIRVSRNTRVLANPQKSAIKGPTLTREDELHQETDDESTDDDQIIEIFSSDDEDIFENEDDSYDDEASSTESEDYASSDDPLLDSFNCFLTAIDPTFEVNNVEQDEKHASISSDTWRQIDMVMSVDMKTTASQRNMLAHYIANKITNQKDIPWKSKVMGTPLEAPAREALQNEMDSFEKNGFYKVDPDSQEYVTALKSAALGRMIVSLKRKDGDGSQRVKVRGVKRGDLTKSEFANTFAPVVPLEVVRAVIMRPNTGKMHPTKGRRRKATVDIKTAYQQGDDRDGPKQYVKFWNYFTNTWDIIFERCPIYGDEEGARWFYMSVTKELLREGFVRGYNPDKPGMANSNEGNLRAPAANCPCLFYHPVRDMVLQLYADDNMLDGYEDDIKWFFQTFKERFELRDEQWLTPETPIDFTGVIISEVHLPNRTEYPDAQLGAVFMSMEPYIKKISQEFNITPSPPGEKVKMPIYDNISDDTPLTFRERKEFMSKVGCSTWLQNTVMLADKFAHSRIAMKMANPTRGALKAINTKLQYNVDHANMGIGIPLYDPEPPTGRDQFFVHVDSDNGCNPDIANKRRAHYCNVMGYQSSQKAVDLIGGITTTHTPVMLASKTLGIAFAHRDITESHGGCGSGENEIYGAANSINDAIYFSYIIEEMGMSFPRPILMRTDARTAFVFMMGTARRTQLRHVDQRQCWVRAARDAGIVEGNHIPGDLNIADIGTKIYFRKVAEFIKRRDAIMVIVPRHKFS